MSRAGTAHDERGIALITVLLLSFAVSGIALAAGMWILNAGLITRNGERNSTLHDVALAGLEEARSLLNADPTLYPAAGYNTVATDAPVTDALGATVPGVLRSLYVGPDGITSGEYGVFGTAISVVRDGFGNRAVRRLQINQESFAKFAYFTNVEGTIVFANNDQIRGPVHSNDRMNIATSGATFFDSLTTAAATINGEGYGNFPGPAPRKSVTAIPLPTMAAFAALEARADNGGMSFVSNNNPGPAGVAPMRLEFVALDLNGDADSTDPGEGFVRIYQDNTRPWYVTGSLTGVPDNDLRRSPNCGAPNNEGVFRTARDTNPNGTPSWRVDDAEDLLKDSDRRCYLGGDPRLVAAAWPAVGAADWALVAGTWNLNNVGWIPRPVGMGAPTTINAFTSRPDAAYLWPIGREYNPAWEGVIYVGGRVAVSGVVNGRVTITSPNNIIIADDFRMAVDPGSAAAADCAMIAGIFSGDSILVANNTLNAPQQIDGAGTWRTYDETTQEDIHATLLTLKIFGAESHATGATAAQVCNGTNSGRGCLNLIGGVIQNNRGPVGLTSGQGYIKRYSYNACASTDPPPYFPTTGRFVRNRFYELDPKDFNVEAWFTANQNN